MNGVFGNTAPSYVLLSQPSAASLEINSNTYIVEGARNGMIPVGEYPAPIYEPQHVWSSHGFKVHQARDSRSGAITWEPSQSPPRLVRLLDVRGRVLYSRPVEPTEIEGRILRIHLDEIAGRARVPSGLYMLAIECRDGSHAAVRLPVVR